jgi:uncharacterized RmlC-like cupin family protein
VKSSGPDRESVHVAAVVLVAVCVAPNSQVYAHGACSQEGVIAVLNGEQAAWCACSGPQPAERCFWYAVRG